MLSSISDEDPNLEAMQQNPTPPRPPVVVPPRNDKA
jgi:hypothetical protein